MKCLTSHVVGGITELGNSCHVFYSQADDVCQVYVLSSVHSVLAFTQMCKPAGENPTYTLVIFVSSIPSWREPLAAIHLGLLRIDAKISTVKAGNYDEI